MNGLKMYILSCVPNDFCTAYLLCSLCQTMAQVPLLPCIVICSGHGGVLLVEYLQLLADKKEALEHLGTAVTGADPGGVRGVRPNTPLLVRHFAPPCHLCTKSELIFFSCLGHQMYRL